MRSEAGGLCAREQRGEEGEENGGAKSGVHETRTEAAAGVGVMQKGTYNEFKSSEAVNSKG